MNSKTCVLNKAFCIENHKFMYALTAFKQGPAWVKQTRFSEKHLQETAQIFRQNSVHIGVKIPGLDGNPDGNPSDF